MKWLVTADTEQNFGQFRGPLGGRRESLEAAAGQAILVSVAESFKDTGIFHKRHLLRARRGCSLQIWEGRGHPADGYALGEVCKGPRQKAGRPH